MTAAAASAANAACGLLSVLSNNYKTSPHHQYFRGSTNQSTTISESRALSSNLTSSIRQKLSWMNGAVPYQLSYHPPIHNGQDNTRQRNMQTTTIHSGSRAGGMGTN